MGSHMSKKSHHDGGTSSSATTTTTINAQQFSAELSSYEAALKLDSDLQSFDTALQARTHQVINSLAVGVEVRALSFESLKDVTECLLEMNQEVVKVILQCKKDIWRSQELFELVEDYFENSLRTLDFCAALDRCLKRARDSQLLVLVALREFDGGGSSPSRSARTLEELRRFRDSGDPFTAEFFDLFREVYGHQVAMLERLSGRKSRLDRKLRRIRAWRKVSSMIFVATFAAILICSVVAAAVAAPPVVAAMAAAAAVPIGSVGKWVDSLWRKYDDALKGQREVIGSMQVGTYVAIKDLDGIRVLIDRLETEIERLVKSAEFAIDGGSDEAGEEAVRVGIEEVRKHLGLFMKVVDELGAQADICSRDIRRARTVVLQRIIKNPNGH